VAFSCSLTAKSRLTRLRTLPRIRYDDGMGLEKCVTLLGRADLRGSHVFCFVIVQLCVFECKVAKREIFRPGRALSLDTFTRADHSKASDTTQNIAPSADEHLGFYPNRPVLFLQSTSRRKRNSTRLVLRIVSVASSYICILVRTVRERSSGRQRRGKRRRL
jgi:hypothetical protein